MRLFEILLILSIFICLIISNKKTKPQLLALLYLLLPLGLHFIYEGWRWQLLPAYLLVPYVILRLTTQTNISKLAFVSSSLLTFIALALSIFIPVPKHPDLNGSYQVGVQLLDAPDAIRKRTLPIKLWFPLQKDINPQALESAPWVNRLDVMGPALAKRAGLPSFTFNHLKYFQTGFIADINNSSVINEKPLVILAHGRSGFKALNSFIALELASQGYVVIAPEIPGGAMLSISNDDVQVPFNPASFAEDKEYSEAETLRIVQQLGENWAKDLTTTMRFIKAKFPQLANKKLFSGGHSTGAAAAINFCVNTDICLGTIALDAWMKPVSESILKNGSTKPILALFGDQKAGDFEPINQERFSLLKKSTQLNNVYIHELEIKRARHIDFCDGALLSPYSYLLGQQKGKIDTREVMHTINQESLRFLSAVMQ